MLFLLWGHLRVGIGSLLLSEGGNDIHKAPVVLDAALSTASLLLLLLLLINLKKKKWIGIIVKVK